MLFNKANHVPLHVIGNHDTDSGYSKEQCVSYWGMPYRYYSHIVEGIRFIILDGNDKGSPSHKGGYPAFIGEEQLNWLKETLEKSQEPIIIASHQPLAGPAEIDNAAEVREILEHAKNRILLAINGHTHIDAHLEIKGIHYVHINSASYFWLGEEYKHESYNKEILAHHPWIACTCPYADALFAILTIDSKRKKLFIEGRKSNWIGKSPAELGYENSKNTKIGKEIVPEIRNKIIQVGLK